MMSLKKWAWVVSSLRLGRWLAYREKKLLVILFDAVRFRGRPCFYSNLRVSSVVQSCQILFSTMNCSQPGSFVHGIFQARILEWAATPRDLPDPGVKPTSLVSPAL